MPCEQVQWFVKQSIHDTENLYARQCCSYYSIINVNRAKNRYSSSYEHVQTWTLTRTMSSTPKKMQASLENIHLTRHIPSIQSQNAHYENMKKKSNRPISYFPPSMIESQKCLSLSSIASSLANNKNTINYQEKQHKVTVPVTIINNNNNNNQNSTDNMTID